MKTLLRILFVVAFGLLQQSGTLAAVWLADAHRAYRVDTSNNLVHWVSLQPAERDMLPVAGGRAWILSIQTGRLIDADGNELAAIAFDARPAALAVDVARGDLFVAGANGVLRFDTQGQPSYLPAAPEPVLAMRVAAGGELWALAARRLYRFSPESGWQAEIGIEEGAGAGAIDFYVDRLRGVVWLIAPGGAKVLGRRDGNWGVLSEIRAAMAPSTHAFDAESGRLWRLDAAAIVGEKAGEKTLSLEGPLDASDAAALRLDADESALWWVSGSRLVAWHLLSGERTEIHLDEPPQAMGARQDLPEFELGLPESAPSATGSLTLDVLTHCGQRSCRLEGSALEGLRLGASLGDEPLDFAVIDWQTGQARLRLPPNLSDGSYPVEAWIESPANPRVAEFALALAVSDGRFALTRQNKANKAPSVSITAPSNNAVFNAPANIDLSVSASDSDGTVKQVSYYRGSTLIGTVTAAPFGYSWKSVSKGSYTLTAKATDNGGASTTSAAITVIVNQPPTVSLTSPANNASFTEPANVTLAASASDGDGSIAKVEFFADGNLLAAKTASPFTFAWNGVAAGSYSLIAKATDNRGASTTSSAIAIKVNAVAAPTVSITSPADNTAILATASLTIKATAKSAGSTISKVEFYDGAALLGSVAGSSSTVNAQLSRSGFSVGDHVLTAKAFDAKGQSTLSSGIRLRVDSAGPTVRITAPAEGAMFGRNAPILLLAEASSRQGSITLVEYFDQDAPIGSNDTSPFGFYWYGADPGDHRLTARATDSKGAAAVSAPVNITVSSNIAPTIGLGISGETFRVPATLKLTAYAADEDGSISKVEFFEGANLLGTVSSAPFEFVWANVGRGNYQVSARATDNQGMSTATDVYGVYVDDTLPTIAVTSPTAGSTLWLGQAGQVSLSGTIQAPEGTRVAIFEPDGPEYGYDATVSGGTFSAAFYPRLNGSGAFVAKATTRSGASAQASVPVKVLRPMIWFTEPGEDATTYAEQFTAGGGFTAPQVESVTVNGQAARVSGKRFELGPVPLALGANFLTAQMTAVLPGGERISMEASAVITRLALSARTVTIDRVDAFDANRVGGLPQVSLGKMWREVRGSFTGGPDTQVTVEDGLGSRVLARLNGGTYSAPIAIDSGESMIAVRAFGPSGPEASATASTFGFPPSGQSVALVRMASPESCAFLPNTPATVSLEAELLLIGTLPIVAVEFSSAEGGVIGTVTQPPYTLQWNNVAAGIYHVRARALASVGASAYSAPVTIGVGDAVACTWKNPPPNSTNYYIAPATIELNASAYAANHDVAKVEFLRDGSLLAAMQAKPYQYNWNGVSPGSYSLVARATTKRGATASTSTQVIVANLGVTLSARDTEYNQGLETLGAPAKVNLRATPTVYGAAIDRIEFIASGTVVGLTRDSPYEYGWQDIPPGTYQVIARAYGNNGATADSPPVTIQVAPLWAMLTSSSAGPLNAPGRVFLSARTKIWQGSIDRIEYYSDSTLIGTVTAAAPSFEWKDISAGNYILTAKVYDTAGSSATSLPVKLDVLGPPAVKLLSPPDGSTAPAGGSITLEAEATAPGSRVTNVAFYRGTVLLNSAVSAPYRFVWTNLPLGTHSVTAVASNAQGVSVTSAPITLHVTNDPGASITAPQAGQSVSSATPVSVVVQAAMPLRAIDRVEIFADGTLLATITANGTPNFSANYSWAGAAVGTHVLKATAYAKDGTKVDTAEVSFAVVGAIKVNLESPLGLTTVLASDTLHFTAHASQEAGAIAAVDFLDGNALLVRRESPPYVFAWKNPPRGNHSITVRAVDGIGQFATTERVLVQSIQDATVQIDPDFDGTILEDDRISISGKTQAPSNSALIVNGRPAAIDIFGNFIVNDVPLSLGSNVITATLSSEKRTKATNSLIINSTGPAPFSVSLDRYRGKPPITVNLIIANLARRPFSSIAIQAPGSDMPLKTATSLPGDQLVVPLTYQKSGSYVIKVVFYGDDQKVIFQTMQRVMVVDPWEMAILSSQTWGSMLGRLRSGKIDDALGLLGEDLRAAYGEGFRLLGNALGDEVAAIGRVRTAEVYDDYVILHVTRQEAGAKTGFEVIVMPDEDGIWRIVSM